MVVSFRGVNEESEDESDAIVGVEVMHHDERKLSTRFDDDPMRNECLRVIQRSEVRVDDFGGQDGVDGVVERSWG